MDGLDGVARVVEDVEVTEKARRRRFTAEYKRRILAEADACTQAGEIGALLRREGLLIKSKAGDEVRNLVQVNVGDEVTVT